MITSHVLSGDEIRAFKPNPEFVIAANHHKLKSVVVFSDPEIDQYEPYGAVAIGTRGGSRRLFFFQRLYHKRYGMQWHCTYQVSLDRFTPKAMDVVVAATSAHKYYVTTCDGSPKCRLHLVDLYLTSNRVSRECEYQSDPCRVDGQVAHGWLQRRPALVPVPTSFFTKLRLMMKRKIPA